MLTGNKKRVLRDVIRYFVTTTGETYDTFILEIQRSNVVADNVSYSHWLAVKSYQMLKGYEITLTDIIENKDVINAAINEDKSRGEGEFYTPEVWCVEGRKYLKDLLGDKWGKAYVWDASCGSGNLMRSENYPQDKLFLSSLLPEDIKMVENSFPDATVFQLDFVNSIDIDENNMNFSEKLPDNLRKVLENNEPLVFYMNPPYFVSEANSSDVGAYMSSIGMTKCALDIFHQFMFRIIMLKRTYNLTNLYLGIFGPITMFHSKMLEPLLVEFRKEFTFKGGMCFDAGDFSNTSESVGWVVGYTTWSTKKEGDLDKSIMLEAKMLNPDNEVVIKGHRLFKPIEETLHKWIEPNDIVRYDMLPSVTNFQNFTGSLAKAPSNAMGYIMTASRVIDATRRAAVTSLPNVGNVPITEENFWRCVASYASRRTYVNFKNPFNNAQYFSKPDTTIEGFEEWVIDGLVLFLFDHDQQSASYRNLVIDSVTYNISNRLFPISHEIVKTVVTDEEILKDLENYPPQNQFLVNILSQVQDRFGEEARELYEFGLTMLLNSLHGTRRKEVGYKNNLKAWDAGLIQVKRTEGMFTQEDQDRHEYLIAKLRTRLIDGVYKYGFMMNAESDTSAIEE